MSAWSIILFAAGFLVVPETSLAQEDLSCSESLENATVLIPDTLALPFSVHPSSVAVFSPEGECVGKTKWKNGAKAIAVAGKNSFETEGLEDGDPLQFWINPRQWDQREIEVSFVDCSELSSGIAPLCRSDGSYREDAIYVLGGVEDVEGVQVQDTRLFEVRPNPVRRRMTVRYAIREVQDTALHIYDVLGRRVRTLVHAEKRGRNEKIVDVSRLSSGTYFLRLTTERETQTKRFVVVR